MYPLLVELARPYTFFYLVGLGLVICLWGKRHEFKWRYALLVSSYLLLGVFSTPIATYYAAKSLEHPYPATRKFPRDAQGIVILGGSVRITDGDGGAVPAIDTIYRCLLGAELYRQTKACPVLVCGGKVEPDRDGPTIARTMANFLVQHGVRAEDIVLEDTSTSTLENTANVAAILRERGIKRVVLVTEATHLMRSEMCFKAVGIDTVPRGAYYRTLGRPSGLTAFLPNSSSAWNMDRVAHEWLGLLWYQPKLAKLKEQQAPHEPDVAERPEQESVED